MKTLIATAIVAMSVTAPAFADTSVKKFFALGNDSAAERIVGETSVGDTQAIAEWAAMTNASAAELDAPEVGVATRNVGLKSFFAMGNDSAAERIVR